MENTNSNDLAYPLITESMMNGPYVHYGLTKRELFSKDAMIGILSNAAEMQVSPPFILEFLGEEGPYNYAEHYPKYIAKLSVLHADALINELNK